jgi:hypothetical protein
VRRARLDGCNARGFAEIDSRPSLLTLNRKSGISRGAGVCAALKRSVIPEPRALLGLSCRENPRCDEHALKTRAPRSPPTFGGSDGFGKRPGARVHCGYRPKSFYTGMWLVLSIDHSSNL